VSQTIRASGRTSYGLSWASSGRREPTHMAAAGDRAVVRLQPLALCILPVSATAEDRSGQSTKGCTMPGRRRWRRSGMHWSAHAWHQGLAGTNNGRCACTRLGVCQEVCLHAGHCLDTAALSAAQATMPSLLVIHTISSNFQPVYMRPCTGSCADMLWTAATGLRVAPAYPTPVGAYRHTFLAHGDKQHAPDSPELTHSRSTA
jgi:hypothetical protein